MSDHDDDSPPFDTEQTPAMAQQADSRRRARDLYWQGWRLTDIGELLKIPRTTLHGWKEAEQWDKAAPIQRVEGALESRLVQLIAKEAKTGADFKEIDLLGRQVERLARVRNYEQTGKEKELNPNIERRNAGPKRSRREDKNFFSEDQVEQLESAFRDSLFGYQQRWWRESQQRTRMILKSRQIGATWYFAREALIDAITTGRNQIFLSASKAQAHIFKQYIIGFAHEACGVELSGDPIMLANGAHLYFLGTNARTAQGYHGNFYFDEFFWTFKFNELNKVALDYTSLIDEPLWIAELQKLAQADYLNPLLSGYACALLVERNLISNDELAKEVSRRLSPGIAADLGAGWFEGLSQRNRYALLTRLVLWEQLAGYVASLTDDEFKRALVFLRRAFGEFSPQEKQSICENLGEIWGANPDTVSEVLSAELNEKEKKKLDELSDFNFEEL